MPNLRYGFIVSSESGSAKKVKEKQNFIAHVKLHITNFICELKTGDEIRAKTKEWMVEKLDVIFACGGDGTVNLVSSELVGSNIALGIIPFGSGNGYARYNNLPLNWKTCLEELKNFKISKRDTGIVNGVHFLNVAGIGYSAKISREFNSVKGRGLRGYLKTIGKNLKLGNFLVSVKNKDAEWGGSVFMLDFCNGTQWGNNVIVSPQSRDNDGTIEAVMFKKISNFRIPVLGFMIASGKIEKSVDIFATKGDSFLVTLTGEQPLHVDGDYIGLVNDLVEVRVISKALNVLS